jgi:polyisoprenoid-binding protein YceI
VFKKAVIGISVFLVAAVVLATAYVLRPTPEASAPIEAVTVETQDSTPETVLEGEESSEGEPTDVLDAEEMPTEVQSEKDESAEDRMVFTIVQDGTEARFTLDEVLRGAPKTVVGTTNQVAGEIVIDFANPENSQVGTILVNARTLVTDSDFRNRAINNEILDTRDHEFITFSPTSISEFPKNPQMGQTLAFQITGDLTIRDITQVVTFEATVTAESRSQLNGSASAVIAREAYELTIPEVPSVANVDEEVLLEIDFVAVAE